jgi:glycosyltransferase involved in cell wall biosynthesis
LGFIKKNADLGFELSYLDPIYNGTSEYALNILPTMIETFSGKKISFKIIASNNIIAKFALEKYGDYLISPEESQNYFFHLLFIPQQIYSDIALEKINRSCFKFVFTLLDVIALRCNYISRGYSLDIPCSLAYKYSEQIIGLTESSAKDIENFFKERMIDRAVTPILLTKEEVIDDKSLDTKEEKISFIGKNYILLIGNAFKHKAIEKALEFLNKSEYNVVVIGYLPEKKKYNDRIKFFESGNESNELINNLYLNSKLIFYPSLYEGFGLPVVAAIQMRKKILVFDSDVNRELKKTFDRNDCVYFFNNFSKISNRIQEVLESPQILNSNRNFSEFRSWKNVSAETSELLLKVFASPINLNKINARIYEVITLKIVERGIQITAMDKTISTLLNSSTLKIGLFITWPIRKIKSFFK